MSIWSEDQHFLANIKVVLKISHRFKLQFVQNSYDLQNRLPFLTLIRRSKVWERLKILLISCKMSNSIFWNSIFSQICVLTIATIDIRLAGRHLSVVRSMLPKQSKGNERTKMVVVRECLSNQENMSYENASTRWFTKLIIGTKDLLFFFEYIHILKKSNAFANYCVRWKWMSDQGVNDNDWHYSMKNRFFRNIFFSGAILGFKAHYFSIGMILFLLPTNFVRNLFSQIFTQFHFIRM